MRTPNPDEWQHLIAAELELLAGFLKVGECCRWSVAEWLKKLDKLPPREARCVVLRLFHGMDFTEIGERLAVSRGRADQLFRAGVRRLAKRYPAMAV
jgi:hypothetical protein